MRPDQLGDFAVPSDAFLHPEGDRAVFVVTRMNIEEDRYESNLWLADADGSRQITFGNSDRAPRWSPDGATIAFLRKGDGDDAKPQVALLPVGGGEFGGRGCGNAIAKATKGARVDPTSRAR